MSARAPLEWAGLCGSERWGRLMAAAGPYRNRAQLQTAAARAFDALSRDDWLQAFAAHSAIGAPRMGDRAGAAEQSELADADPVVVAELVRLGDDYRRRFGFVFLIRAAGRSAPELLEALRARIDNDPELEFATACSQQREITALRLEAAA